MPGQLRQMTNREVVGKPYLFTAKYANIPSHTRLQKSRHSPLSLADWAEKR